MEISGYGIPGAISGYGTQYISQTSSKPFTIPVWGEDVSKKDNTPIAGDDPFKDGTIKLPEWMNTKTEPTRSDAAHDFATGETRQLNENYSKTYKEAYNIAYANLKNSLVA